LQAHFLGFNLGFLSTLIHYLLSQAQMIITDTLLSPIRLTVLGDSKKDLSRFWEVMVTLSGPESTGVLPLQQEVIAVLGNSNPFWTHAQRCLWIAERDGRVVGRIAGIIDPTHQKIHQDQTAFFGFLDCIDDPLVAEALFQAVILWSRDLGCNRLRGPMNPSINEECGLLISGFERPNAVMLPYSAPYLPKRIEECGFSGVKDLKVIEITLSDGPMERLTRLKKGVIARLKDVRLVSVTRSTLALHLPELKEVYNSAWEKNWGAVPMTSSEINFLATRLRPLLVDGLVWLAEVGGKPAGFLLAVPDVNEALGPLRGQLLSFSLIRALPILMGWRRPKKFRIVALGVTAAYRRQGIEGLLFAETLSAGLRLGFKECEASWVLEDNYGVHQLAEVFCGRTVQHYRIYERSI